VVKKILVPLDGSALAECSLQNLKIVTAGESPAEVILLKVVEPINPSDAHIWAQAGYMFADLMNRKKDDASAYLSHIVETLAKTGISARAEVVSGMPAESILDFADKNNVDLILISTHGRSGISRWAFGSVADRVVSHAKIPVLLISAPGCRTNK
jgi:nucleotide-binding universal stress UspA family protein